MTYRLYPRKPLGQHQSLRLPRPEHLLASFCCSDSCCSQNQYLNPSNLPGLSSFSGIILACIYVYMGIPLYLLLLILVQPYLKSILTLASGLGFFSPWIHGISWFFPCSISSVVRCAWHTVECFFCLLPRTTTSTSCQLWCCLSRNTTNLCKQDKIKMYQDKIKLWMIWSRILWHFYILRDEAHDWRKKLDSGATPPGLKYCICNLIAKEP